MAESYSKQQDNSQALLAELNVHLAEYNALRTEIQHMLGRELQFLNFNLISLGVGLGVIPFIIEQRAFFILLVFPLVFHVLLWEGLRAVQNIFQLSGYLSDRVIPRVNTILDGLSIEKRENIVLGWEFQVAIRPVSTSELVFTSITPTRHWSPILSIAAMLIAYLAVTKTYGYSVTLGELLMVVLNLIFLVLAAVRNIQIFSLARERAESVRKFLAQRASPEEIALSPAKNSETPTVTQAD